MSHVPMDEPRPSMELAQHSMSDIYQSTPQSATSSHAASSPSLSVFSRGHNPSRSGGSSSSLASSPITRESLDWFAPSKRLEDVREEPQEREEVYDCWSTGSNILEDKAAPHRLSFDLSIMGSPPDSDYSFGDNDNESWFTSNPSVRRSKRQRSAEYPPSGATTRLLSHFPSLSKRWKYKSGVDPQLSIITHMDRAASRNSSGTSSHLISPALSAISKHESHLPPSPVRTLFDDRMSDSSPAPIAIDKVDEGQGEEAVQARTPLLPPIFSELSRKSSPIQSPLQSPSIADAPVFPTSNTPSGTPQLQSLPSPPLSTKPSISSMRQRSRANTGTVPMAQVPALQMLDEHQDEWAPKLGHANFDIDPEPYTPEKMDMDSLQQLRANRDLARNNYEKHREQTGENYGTTSKIYRFTQAKWSQIDAEWEKEIERVTAALRPVAALRPALDVVEDASGKFPKMAEEGMVGVMDVVPARALTMKRTVVATEPPSQPLHQRKRSFIKFISDILGRGNGARP